MQTLAHEYGGVVCLYLVLVHRSMSLYISILALCYGAKIMSRKYVKFLLDVQRNAFNDVRSNMRTTFNERLCNSEKNGCDLRSKTLFFNQAHQQKNLCMLTI